MTLHSIAVETPLGLFTMIIQRQDDTHATHIPDKVVAAGFSNVHDLQLRLDNEFLGLPVEEVPQHAYGQLVADYFNGDLYALTAIAHKQSGTPLYGKAWEAMTAIQPGETVSYTELAVRSGNPTAVRAIGSACAENRLILLVPCHRIVKSNGDIGNYLYGAPIKKYLLDHETAFSTSYGIETAPLAKYHAK